MKRALGFFLAVVLSVNVWPSTVVSAAEISGSQTENLVEESDTTEENEETDETDNKEAGSEEEKEPSLENNEDLNSEDSENSETSENEGNSESTEISENTENEENNDNTETEVTEATEEDQASEDESEEQGFVVTFNSFEGGKYVAYDRQNADEAIVTDDAVSAIARNSDTGEIDTTGSGQVNFSVVLDEGYAFESIEITEGTANYKNLKTISEEGNVFSYRITKITGNLTVTVTAKKLSDEGTRAKLIEGLEEAIKSCPKYFETYCTAETASALSELLGTIKEFDYEVVSDEDIVAATENVKEAIANLVYKTAEVPQVYISTENGDGNSLVKQTGYVNTDITIVDTEGNVLSQNGSIKVRGNSTAGAEKKAFNIKFASKQDVFGMGKAKKWCLLANCFDASLMRNATALEIAREMGITYTSESQYVELWMDGVFKGCYQLTEAVEAGKTRVDIDVDADDFMLELEKSRTEDGTTYITNANGLRFSFKEPEEPSAEKVASVQATLDRITDIIDSGDYAAVSEAIDIDSFARFFVFNEYMKNADFNFSSVYFYYKDGVLYAGPAWDYDLSSGNAKDSAPNLKTPNNVWAQKCNWYPYLLKYSEFQKKIEDIYAQYSDYLGSITADGGFVDTTYATYKNVFDRNFSEAGWIVSKKYSVNQMTPFETLDENVQYFKNFLYERHNWMDSHYGKLIPNVWVYPATIESDGIIINWREEGDADGYRVYRRIDDSWAPISGVIHGNTFTDYSAEAGVDYFYDVVSIVNGSRGSLDYKGVPARMEVKQATELSIITQPKDVEVYSDKEIAVFSVEAAGKDLKYMWYEKNSGSDRFIKTGVDAPEYSRHMTAKLDGMQVYCVVTDIYGHKETTDIASAYFAKKFIIVNDTVDIVVPKKGDYGTFTIDVQGDDVTYCWYVNKTEQAGGDGKFHKAGCFTSEYAVRASEKTEGMQAYCLVKNSDGEKLIGRTATLTIDKEQIEVSYPNGKEIEANSGNKASFRVEVAAEDVTYSWYCMVPAEAGGDGKFHKAGCYTNEYVRTASKKTNGMQAYCNITDSKGRLTKSDIIVLKVN